MMPVFTYNCDERVMAWMMSGDSIHTCMTHATHLKVLCDWIIIPGMGIASIGDAFVTVCEYTMWPAPFLWAFLMIKDSK